MRRLNVWEEAQGENHEKTQSAPESGGHGHERALSRLEPFGHPQAWVYRSKARARDRLNPCCVMQNWADTQP